MKMEVKFNVVQAPNQQDLSSGQMCFWGLNLQTLPSICEELLVGQARNRVNFEFESQSPHKTKGILAMVFYTSGPNSVILA